MKSPVFTPEGKAKPKKGKAKRQYEEKRILARQGEGFEALSWVDPETGKRVKMSQMGRKVTVQ